MKQGNAYKKSVDCKIKAKLWRISLLLRKLIDLGFGIFCVEHVNRFVGNKPIRLLAVNHTTKKTNSLSNLLALYWAKNPVPLYNWSESRFTLNLLPLETINSGLVLPECLWRDIDFERSPSKTSTESHPFSILKWWNVNSIIWCCGASIIQVQFRLSPYLFG